MPVAVNFDADKAESFDEFQDAMLSEDAFTLEMPSKQELLQMQKRSRESNLRYETKPNFDQGYKRPVTY